VRIRRARAGDIPKISGLIDYYSRQGRLLPRDPNDIRKHLQGFLVGVEKRNVIGCAALDSYNPHLAEIRSLAVHPDARARGLGAQLLAGILERAEKRQIGKVFALTSAPRFFLRSGFHLASRHSIKDKLQRDCAMCPKAPNCQLSAVVMNLSASYFALNIIARSSESVPAL